MKIETKYDVGQTVWQVYPKHVTAPCNVCDGTGWVELKGNSWLCPSCRGGKTMLVPGCHEPHKDKIEDIRVSSGGVSYTVGFGIMPEDELFPIKEEAQAEADRLNMEAGKCTEN